MLPRHVDEPSEADERHDRHEDPNAAHEPGPARHRRDRVVTTGPGDGDEKDRDRQADPEHHRTDARAPGMREDDAVDDPGVVERGAGHGHRRDAGEGGCRATTPPPMTSSPS